MMQGPSEERIDRYALVAPIGRGGMGEVHRAFDPRLKRQIALKLLSGDADPRLLREAQVMAQLSHSNVVQVYDAGVANNRVWIAMELIDGVDLRVWLRERPREWREVLDCFIEAGRGLAAAHAVGIVHRDFKPGNALVSRDGRVVVGDFGLARPVAAAEGGLAVEGTLTLSQPGKGTPKYMAPEQMLGGVVDARADQYSFCVALIEALDAAGAPERVRAVALRALVPDPAGRWASMDALLAALEAAREEPAAPAKRGKVMWAWIGAAVIAVGVLAGVGLAAGTDGPAARVAPVAAQNAPDDQAANQNREAGLAAPEARTEGPRTETETVAEAVVPEPEPELVIEAAPAKKQRRRGRGKRVKARTKKVETGAKTRPEPDGVIRDLWSSP